MSTEQLVETKTKRRKETREVQEQTVDETVQQIGSIVQELVMATTVASIDLAVWLYERKDECDLPESIIELVKSLRELVGIQKQAVIGSGTSAELTEKISRVLQDLLTAANTAALDLALYSKNDKCKLPNSLYDIIVALKKLFSLQKKRI